MGFAAGSHGASSQAAGPDSDRAAVGSDALPRSSRPSGATTRAELTLTAALAPDGVALLSPQSSTQALVASEVNSSSLGLFRSVASAAGGTAGSSSGGGVTGTAGGD